MTPERIEEIKSTLLVIQEREKYTIPSFLSAVSDYQDNSAKWLVGLLAALEESQQQNVTLKEELEDKINESNEFYKWWQEEVSQRNIYKHELAEAQQTIARLQAAAEDEGSYKPKYRMDAEGNLHLIKEGVES